MIDWDFFQQPQLDGACVVIAGCGNAAVDDVIFWVERE
jgi:hypothetical protein